MTLAEKIASKLHEDWRKTRLLPDGTFEPRWKKVKDEGFVDSVDFANLPANLRIADGGGDLEIDIANSQYADLSPDWQAENKAAAEVVAGILESGKDCTVDEVGEIIHDEWLKRNSWAKEDPKLGVPFKELSKEEQNKDLAQYNIGIETLQEELTKENTPIKTKSEKIKE